MQAGRVQVGRVQVKVGRMLRVVLLSVCFCCFVGVKHNPACSLTAVGGFTAESSRTDVIISTHLRASTQKLITITAPVPTRREKLGGALLLNETLQVSF